MLLPREYLIQCWAVLFIYDGSQVDYSQTESQGLLGAINRLTTTHLPGIISPQTHPSLLSVRLEAGDQVSEVLQRCLRGNEQPNFEFYMVLILSALWYIRGIETFLYRSFSHTVAKNYTLILKSISVI